MLLLSWSFLPPNLTASILKVFFNGLERPDGFKRGLSHIEIVTVQNQCL